MSGRLFEAASALLQRRRPSDLYHSALEVVVPEGRFVVEMTPIPDSHGEQRGVVVEGPVGTAWGRTPPALPRRHPTLARRRDPDADQATHGPVRVSDDLTVARALLDLVPAVPNPV